MSLQPTRFLPFAFVAGLLPFIGSPGAKALDKRVADIEEQRVQVVEKIKMSVLAIFSRDGQGNVQGSGSGVLISEDGFALTNFHVVAGMPPVMLCGIADGNLYDAVIVGQDKVGDVALIKLLPPKDKPDFKFQPAKLGDSDKCRAGDWSLAAGNPFLLATDFTPTVTFGFISGVNRYQYPEGKFIEYTDCIQIDTSINPGNSGGPLFNMDGELIGINGRGSFDKRWRINSGVGYAISINQIKNFMGHLRAGLQVDHASMGCLVESDQEEKYAGPLKIRTIIKSDTMRRGLEPGDELVTFNGWPVTSVNMFKNKLGIYPKGWRVPVEYRHGSEPKKEIADPPHGHHPAGAGPQRKAWRPCTWTWWSKAAQAEDAGCAGTKLYEAKDGFTNYYFNKQERDRILKEFASHGKFTDVAGTWTIKSGEGSSVNHKRATAEIIIHHKGAKDGVNDSVDLGHRQPARQGRAAGDQPKGQQPEGPRRQRRLAGRHVPVSPASDRRRQGQQAVRTAARSRTTCLRPTTNGPSTRTCKFSAMFCGATWEVRPASGTSRPRTRRGPCKGGSSSTRRASSSGLRPRSIPTTIPARSIC